MPFCSNCGKQLDDNSVFCDKCGTKVVKDDQNKPQITEQTKPEPEWKKIAAGIKRGAEISIPHLKKASRFLVEKAKIAADNMEKRSKEGGGMFSPFDWQPPEMNPLDMALPRGLSIDSFNDSEIFGTETKPKNRPFIPKALKVLIYKRDKGVCKICGKKVDWHDYNIAHDKAFSKGGEMKKSNLFTAHPLCNRSMGTKTLKEAQKIMGNV